MDRNKKARNDVKVKLQKEKEVNYNKRMEIARLKNKYITELTNGRYFLERCNMIGPQLQDGAEIKEKIDGCLKTFNYLKAEYAVMKRQAITSMRNAHFEKKDLMVKYNFSEADILAIEEDYYNGKIIRESYDDEYKKGGKAEFTQATDEEIQAEIDKKNNLK